VTDEVFNRIIVEFDEIIKNKAKKAHHVTVKMNDDHNFDASFTGSNGREFQVYSDNSAIRARFGYGDDSFVVKLYSHHESHRVIGYLHALTSDRNNGRSVSFKDMTHKYKITKKRLAKNNHEPLYAVDCVGHEWRENGKHEVKYRVEVTQEDLKTLLDCMTKALHWSLDWQIRDCVRSKTEGWQAERMFR